MISCRPRAATPGIVFILLFSCLSATSVVPAPGQAPDSQFLTTARQKYYNLRDEGLGDLEAKIVPDWRVILGRPSPDVATERLLSGLQFSMTIDARTNFRIDHGSQAGAAGNQSMQIARIYANMDQAVTQFVICWSLFQLTSPLPAANSGYGVTRERSGYRFSHHEDRNRVDTTVSDDFKIVEIRTTGPDFVASIRPNLQPTAKGFMLAGWAG